MKRQQQRFNSERAIHAAINGEIRNQNALLKEADEYEATGKSYVKTNNPDLVESGVHLIKKAEHIRTVKMDRSNVKLTKLKNALASFNTTLLPGMPGDSSVVLENLK